VYRSRIDLRVRKDERDQWEAWADELGLGMSEMIRRAVPLFYQTEKPKTRLKVLSVPQAASRTKASSR
jgi:hypothetical protein